MKTEVLLGIDYGEKFTGLAFSPDSIIALPVKVIATENILQEVKDIVEQKNCSKIIMGLPISSDGSENHICEQIRSTANLLERFAPIEFINERYSSQDAGGPKNKRMDDVAAAKILEYYLA